jgi:hypothetical protein
MKNAFVLSILAFVVLSCNKEKIIEESSPYSSSNVTSFSIDNNPGLTVENIILSETNFIERICQSMRYNQAQLGKDIFDFQMRSVVLELAASSVNSSFESSDPIDNYVNSATIYFDKNDGSSPISIASSNSLNAPLTIPQNELVDLVVANPGFTLYFEIEFDQMPSGYRNISLQTRLEMLTNYKYKK